MSTHHIFTLVTSCLSSIPVCLKIDTNLEGWYREDGSLITLMKCDGSTLQCNFIGTRMEGWYMNKVLITKTSCRNDINIGEICSTNDECDGNTYCGKSQGQCSNEGNCMYKTTICTRHLEPICGCDGKNYSNPCMAAMVGISVDYAGWCQDQIDCAMDSDCHSSQQYCSKPTGFCGTRGLCITLPELCTGVYDPVCGCDDMNYNNPCLASSNSTSVKYHGPCDTIIRTSLPCRDNTGCSENEFCQKGLSLCSRDVLGECLVRPMICTLEYLPVCGCDGVTYGNICAARSSGANIAKQGEC